MYASGIENFAVGANTKIIVKKCNHPNKQSINEEHLKDRLPIPEWAWTHCVFYRNNDGCAFGGDCKYKTED